MTASINPQHIFSQNDYAIVILNREILFNADFFAKIWNNARIRQVVDGGANRFFNLMDQLPKDSKDAIKFPDIASGDFDSITDLSLNRLKSNATCKVVVTEDQNNTDFFKGLVVLRDHIKSHNLTSKVTKIVVICECTGRLDHILGNLNTMHKNVFLNDSAGSANVYLLGSDTQCWLLPANVRATLTFRDEVPNITCGIVPLMGSTQYESKGLEWDLNRDMECQFGGLVSTSNNVIRKIVEITSFEKHSILTLEIHQNQYILA